ncbi:hypothetical protein L3V18_08955 [Lysobacter sp. TLK-CK17T]|uniref:Uncharacterized protein n=1 Tax=Marilutibacter chinensis TaxID=2912247 RepID=A0ABS9HU58_9GAMM|nr:hypothetical protein [Lysobacter chinensis]
MRAEVVAERGHEADRLRVDAAGWSGAGSERLDLVAATDAGAIGLIIRAERWISPGCY